MNVKKILLASVFILAIITVGAASASDNVTSDGVVLASSETEGLQEVSVDDSEDVLSDGYYYDGDFYVYVQENYSQDKSNPDEGELIGINSYSNSSGNFTVSVDNVEKLNVSLTDGYFEKVDDGEGGIINVTTKFIYPKDLGLDIGSYNVKVSYNEKTLVETSVSISQRDDFEIWMQNPYYGEKEYWTYPSFMIIDSYNLFNGTLEIYVNGTRKLSCAVENGHFKGIPGSTNRSRCIAACDLIGDYGRYNIQVKFTENGTSKTLMDENVTVAEFEPTSDPRIDIYFDFYNLVIPADNIAHIYLPREATGNLTISYNNVKNKTVKYSKGYGEDYIESWNLNHLGENEITVTYMGDDFGTLTAKAYVNVLPDITCPDYVVIGDEFSISILTYNWVDGTLSIYDYTDDVKGELLGSDWIKAKSGNYFATATVKLLANKSGTNKFLLDYYDIAAGHYSFIKEVYVIKNTEKVNVILPSAVPSNSSFNITVTGPDVDFTFAQITVDDGATDFVMLEKGVAQKEISNLTDGLHTIIVFYENRNFIDVDDVYLNAFIVNVGAPIVKIETGFIATSCVFAPGYPFHYQFVLGDLNYNKLPHKLVVADIAGQILSNYTNDDGEVGFTFDFDIGNYTGNVSFAGDDHYWGVTVPLHIEYPIYSTNLTSNDLNLTVGNSGNLIVSLRDVLGCNMSGELIVIRLDGKTYNMTTNSTGQICLPIDLAAGSYVADISYSGDKYYRPSSATSKIVVNKIQCKLSAPGSVTKTYNVNKNFVVTLTDDKGNPIVKGNVTFVINNAGRMYRTNELGQITIPVSNLAPKNYVAKVTYSGDDMYGGLSKDVKIAIKKATPKLTATKKTFKAKTKTKKYTVVLKANNGKAISKAKLTLKVKGKIYKAITNSKGKATFKITKLTKKGRYSATVTYAGNKYYNKVVRKNVKITVRK